MELSDLQYEVVRNDKAIWHNDVMKWKHFPRYWPFVRGNHRWPVNSLRKGQWRGAWLFSLICAWINGKVNNREAGEMRRHRAHYDVNLMRIARSSYPGPCITPAIWRCRKTVSQWQGSFQWKLRSHWLKFLRQRPATVIVLGTGHVKVTTSHKILYQCPRYLLLAPKSSYQC